MPSDDPDQVEIQVIQDVLDAIETRLRDRERHGWRLTVPRSRVYAALLHAVIVSARESHCLPATLDRATILDTILDGVEPSNHYAVSRPIEDVLDHSTVPVN
ncbi:hypothetical protein KHQ06_21615 [Nocardia tengchongensis]|uniref:Uncharacterized protein n=1 Tax=Nocardia tengchongensis TaxID=2055889 RepID=A0ABX8CHR6_9NOCA|nr:hypothetical protein [Nocardia tengchongensis]QVI19064.1 hypothetical protein KHQ06_21615 [Nocardia tengchongensis]